MSKETKWTPAPWNVDGSTVYALGKHGVNSFSVSVQSAGKGRIESDEIEANAKLIAAAPDLYEALEGLYELLMHPSLDADETIPELVATKTALAKARGEQ